MQQYDQKQCSHLKLCCIGLNDLETFHNVYKFTKQIVYLYPNTNLYFEKSFKGYTLNINRRFVKWQDWVWSVFALSLCFLLLSNFLQLHAS